VFGPLEVKLEELLFKVESFLEVMLILELPTVEVFEIFVEVLLILVELLVALLALMIVIFSVTISFVYAKILRIWELMKLSFGMRNDLGFL